ncbi:MAG: polyprenyl diphosphate synthase [Planctomycetota bacterium]|nr:polyprenyl diphosphate synthase [Planctomycetota bacterium]
MPDRAAESPVATGHNGQHAAALARIRQRNPDADPARLLPDVDPARIPRHVAIIMDGNGRWAAARGLPREFGHRAGAKVVREVVEHAGNVGVEVVTLYSFSLENWKRPPGEIEALMHLCRVYLDGEEAELVRRGIRFRVIGRRAGLPSGVVEAIERVERSTSGGTRGTLCLAINYGARAELADAARRLARDVASGAIAPDAVDEGSLASRLYAPDLPDPDLLIRTAGEMRVSNFLLWQISYAELHVTPVLWPDFGPACLDAAIRDFASRSRRFGAISEQAHA